MKKTFLILSALCVFGSSSHAQSTDAKVVNIQEKVKVLNKNHELITYSTGPGLKKAIFGGTWLSLKGDSALKCPAPLLGTLAEDFTVTIRSRDGVKSTITYAGNDHISVYGNCHHGSKKLTQVSFRGHQPSVKIEN